MTHVFTLTKDEVETLHQKLKTLHIKYDVPYTAFQARADGLTITAYQSGKVVVQGSESGFYIDLINQLFQKDVVVSKDPKVKYPMAGSDEVGTGDYFGGVTVCACIVKASDLKRIPLDKIQDTKQMNDDVILEVAPILMKELQYSLMVLDNIKYNQVRQSYNLNTIKSMLHNQAFLSLEQQGILPDLRIIDQFLAEKPYYASLSHVEHVVKGLSFVTKAENKYIAVACGAIIARYAFLEMLDQYGKTYDCVFPKGAGAHVDAFGKKLVARYGPEILKKVAKYHFANTDKIIPV